MAVLTSRLTASALFTILLAVQTLALTPDPSGASKVGNAAHQSSIGSQCTSSLDCGANGNTACCAFLPQAGGATIGICSGCGATTQQGKQGCGFGDAGKASLASDPQICPASSFAGGALPSASNASSAPAGQSSSAASTSAAPAAAAAAAAGDCTTARVRRSTTPDRRRAAWLLSVDITGRAQQLPDPSLDAGAGNAQHAQFVTGRCVSAADCGAGQADLSQVCCASVADAATGQLVGVCSGSAVGNVSPKQGCGFGDGLASSAAVATGSSTAAAGTTCQGGAAAAQSPAAAAPAAASSPAAGSSAGGAKLPDPSLDAGKGNQQNKQFVTGACINAKDCGASQADLSNVCCASVMSGGQVVGVCSGSAVGNAAPKLGCGFGDGKANAAA